MVSKIVLCFVIMVAAATAVSEPESDEWRPIPPWVAAEAAVPELDSNDQHPIWIHPWVATSPWAPQLTECKPNMRGSVCRDCTTRLICTKKGGLIRPCSDPDQPHCNSGECSATPSAACGEPVVPASSH